MPIVQGVLVAIPPPKDYTGKIDFDNPQRQSVTASYAICAVGMVISTSFMLQRLYVKHYLRNTLGFDDLLLVIAWIGALAIQGLIIYSFHEVIMGVHGWEVPFETFRKFAVIGGYTTSIVYTVPTTLSKMVILLFYRQIDNPSRFYRISVHIVMFVVGASGIAILFASIFPCHPFKKGYDLLVPPEVGHCIDRKAMYSATAGLGVATDVLIMAIPVPMVISLRMSLIKKFFLMGVFAVGSATVVTSVIRLALLLSILDKIDQTWGGGPVCMWICVEANLLIICASMCTIKHFFQAVAPKLSISSSPSSSKKSSRTLSANHELRTFGAGSSRKRYYSRFDETDIGTDTIIRVQGLPHDETINRDKDTKHSGADDQGSDTGIIQTKETHVYYEST